MSAEDRSSSAVRSLRSIFETKSAEGSPDTRGRSITVFSDQQSSRPTSSIRASFVPVEAPAKMADEEGGEKKGLPEAKRESSAGLRRGSFSESNDGGSLLALKKTVSKEAERREKDSNVAEAIPEIAAESAAVTPLMPPQSKDKADETIEDSPLAQKVDRQPANPDKPTTAAEEEPVEMKPGIPTDEDAVSGGQALPPVAENLKPDAMDEDIVETQPSAEGTSHEETPAAKTTGNVTRTPKKEQKAVTKGGSIGKPKSVSTKAPSKAAPNSPRSPISHPKTPISAKAHTTTDRTVSSSEQPAKKSSRSSLTNPTAASVARAAASSDRSVSTSSKPSPQSKSSRPREGTKPVELPSRLTAPTASSRARHEAATVPLTTNGNRHASASSRNPMSAATRSSRPTPRSSLGAPGPRPESRTSGAANKKPHADGSFLERMMRPTAASSNRTHEKVEVKSPPRLNRSASIAKPRMNGHVKKPSAAASKLKGLGKSETATVPEKGVVEGQGAAPITNGVSHKAEQSLHADQQTPVAHTNGVDGEMETTSAFAGEDTIR
ncbi:hypothetical protein BAUCODRAFT_554759 [Baudoinia panamericana UAMH 10762]|uniref:Uncharacterized protein n=1 Tax=Baudoinia panamericana (strain UAMH 10762) TaxID=717646 RepID=M2MDM1_BAUPA|nr:uncharacterized protein BAUCODRAFT_554759 [Baudoinia panamericana UAMH 10762]EMC94646.1 hypothetical protein BAUCODRAFT_554759 [Baudoinia panamericana UAMH 10762]